MDPPKRLSPEAKKIWRDLVASRPPGHFNETGAMLEELCLIIVSSYALAREIHAVQALRPRTLAGHARKITRLGPLIDRECAMTRAVCDLTTRLGLTQRRPFDATFTPDGQHSLN